MLQKNRRHLRIGTLFALSESPDATAQKRSEVEHTESCLECSTLFNFLVKYGKVARESKEAIHTKCPQSDMDALAFFFSFFRDGLPEEEGSRFLKHINNCYFCFQIFITNWSAYLQGRENR